VFWWGILDYGVGIRAMKKSNDRLTAEADTLLGTVLEKDEAREYWSFGYTPSFEPIVYDQPNWWRGDKCAECGRPRSYGSAARCRHCYRTEAKAKYKYKLAAFNDLLPHGTHAMKDYDTDETRWEWTDDVNS